MGWALSILMTTCMFLKRGNCLPNDWDTCKTQNNIFSISPFRCAFHWKHKWIRLSIRTSLARYRAWTMKNIYNFILNLEYVFCVKFHFIFSFGIEFSYPEKLLNIWFDFIRLEIIRNLVFLKFVSCWIKSKSQKHVVMMILN